MSDPQPMWFSSCPITAMMHWCAAPKCDELFGLQAFVYNPEALVGSARNAAVKTFGSSGSSSSRMAAQFPALSGYGIAQVHHSATWPPLGPEHQCVECQHEFQDICQLGVVLLARGRPNFINYRRCPAAASLRCSTRRCVPLLIRDIGILIIDTSAEALGSSGLSSVSDHQSVEQHLHSGTLKRSTDWLQNKFC